MFPFQRLPPRLVLWQNALLFIHLLPLGFPTQKVPSGRFVLFLCSFHRTENAPERQGSLPCCPGTRLNCNPIPLFIKKRERAERGRHWADSLIVMLLSDNQANLIHLFHLNLAAMSSTLPSTCFILHPVTATDTVSHSVLFLVTHTHTHTVHTSDPFIECRC